MSGKYRKTVSVITYAKQGKKINYLIFNRKLHWKGWEFPKGGVGVLETKRHAVKREVKEETGLDVLKVKKFGIRGKYLYKKELKDRPGIIGHAYSLYGAEIKKQKIVFDKKEHSGYKWVSFKEAVKKLSWPDQIRNLKFVNSWLNKHM